MILHEVIKQMLPRYVGAAALRMDSLCPVAAVNGNFLPSAVVSQAQTNPETLLAARPIWECLCCGLCEENTNDEIPMSNLIRELRTFAYQAGYRDASSQSAPVISAQRIYASSPGYPSAPGWLNDTLKVTTAPAEYLYWPGCASLYAALPGDDGSFVNASAGAAVRCLNACGITPLVLQQPHYSGFDLLWTGDLENFNLLAQNNVEAIKQNSVKTIIVSSPEDYHTLKFSYRPMFENYPVRIRHITEVLSERLPDLRLKPANIRITYHDPCRLGRGMCVYEAPRNLIKAVPGVSLLEMRHTKNFAHCCGTSCWTQSGKYAKLMQLNRLQEAVDTGAELLLCSCWECGIHFRMAMNSNSWQQVGLPVDDLIRWFSSMIGD
jgi:Fe-S oxidoreductase